MIKMQCEFTIVKSDIVNIKYNQISDPSTTELEIAVVELLTDIFKKGFDQITPKVDASNANIDSILKSVGKTDQPNQ